MKLADFLKANYSKVAKDTIRALSISAKPQELCAGDSRQSSGSRIFHRWLLLAAATGLPCGATLVHSFDLRILLKTSEVLLVVLPCDVGQPSSSRDAVSAHCLQTVSSVFSFLELSRIRSAGTMWRLPSRGD